jgi:antitoxin HicB
MEKDLNYYLNLPWTFQLHKVTEKDGDSYYSINVLELTGCMSDGETQEEALEMIKDALAGYLESCLKHGDVIPEPNPEREYSGKWLQRAPKTLHRQLAKEAEREGVSFNQYCLYKLAQ